MKSKEVSRLLALLAVSIGLLVPREAPGSSQQSAQKSSIQASQQSVADALPEGRLTRIDPRRVCMVTNRAFDEAQLPIDIKGKTYYGCCNMCKGVLEKDRTQRFALDPVSKKRVDKSLAVIGVGANKGVLYFENETNLDKYNSSHVR
jgi:YHS domain-containing protein